MVSLLLASKGILLYSVSSSVLTGVALGVVYKRFYTLKKEHAQQIEQLQATQQALETRLADLQPDAALTGSVEQAAGAVTAMPPVKASSEDMESTKGVFLKHLLQANVQLQAEA